MDNFPRIRNCPAKCSKNTLLTHTHTQNGNFPGKVEDGGCGDASIRKGMTWPRTDDQLCWVEGDEFVEGYLIVTVGRDVVDAQGNEVLDDIVGKTVRVRTWKYGINLS